MNISFGQLMLGMVFGTIGMGLFMFGKRAERLPHLAAGLVLMVFPYFVSNMWALALIGATVTAAPFVMGE